LKRMGYEIVAEMFDEAAGEITGSECWKKKIKTILITLSLL
jgi:hypothetical protein